MTGIERLRVLSTGTKNQALLKVIDYLETRKDMYERFLNEEKTPYQMWEYITQKAKELSINNCAVIDDRIVYAWAISYFLATNESLNLIEKKVDKTTEGIKNETKKSKAKITDGKNKEIQKEQQNNVIDMQTAKSSDQITIFEEV